MPTGTSVGGCVITLTGGAGSDVVVVSRNDETEKVFNAGTYYLIALTVDSTKEVPTHGSDFLTEMKAVIVNGNVTAQLSATDFNKPY